VIDPSIAAQATCPSSTTFSEPRAPYPLSAVDPQRHLTSSRVAVAKAVPTPIKCSFEPIRCCMPEPGEMDTRRQEFLGVMAAQRWRGL
jgi:hypothetical protein